MELFLQLFFIIIIATKIAGVISVRFGQPSVLGKLIIGVIIGPAVFGWIPETDVIKALSHIGVLLLMFIASHEMNRLQIGRGLCHVNAPTFAQPNM
ncbi:cation:proton antiporter domain-containing protein [Peribacillus huizhouensis]|uniref:Kef-type K+ transport system membrane component KefB n=1 Tax=Peribacillus huizhouensis TaxID=1501239 RepID=A0ABR6CMI4_9BACI|nr:cation:proton antiporter [Peribacillus huizhouensis]MBA9026249.1 Kef-type K+ transport system membrane component KefB [Peribacillus huizhouensis]